MPKHATGTGAIRRAIDSLSAAELHRSSGVKWRLFGEDVLPAWVADMDFPVAPPVHRAIRDLVGRHDLGYHIIPLSPSLRDALVSRMAERFSWQVEPSRVVPLVNVVQGLDASVLLHSRPEDGVIVQVPIYPPFLAAVLRSGRRLVENPLLRAADRFEIDFDQLRANIDPSTRLLLLCNPHNPSGRVFERAELTALGELALEHDWIVVSDEIHADLAFPGHRHLPFASLGPELAQRTITLTSATKAFNLAGLPCAFAIFGSDRVQQPFRDLPPHVLGHCGILDDAATHAAWTEGQPWLDEVMAYLLENRRLVLDFFARELPAVHVLPPEATYLAWLDCRDLGLPGDPFQFFLEHARVALSRGPDFGTGGEGCARLNFATSQAILLEILERMAAAVRR
ncbi:MAG: PatB family C-S lyase [Deltaproteobacteria bacterium]|nr:PatB family C-S lyase [Deltaproteobacteria bacterium]